MPDDSTKPLGATSYKETALGTISRDQLLPLETEGTKRGLDQVYSLIKSTTDVQISPELIKELHAVSYHWIFPDWGGKFRTIQVTYSGKEAPHFAKIPELTVNLCQDLKTRLEFLPKPSDQTFIVEVVSLLAWFQHQFVYIHPFQDYNGRLARMLTTLLLLMLKLPAAWISVDSLADRQNYLEAMQAGDEGNLVLLETIIEKSLVKALEN